MRLTLALLSSSQWKKRSSKGMMIRGRKRRRRGDNWVAPEIPLDLMIEILTRLPGKSLMRFKCLSKLWYSLIRCRYFTNRRYLTDASLLRSPRMYMSLYMSLWDHLTCGFLDVCQNPGKSVLLSLSCKSAATCTSSFDQDLTMPGMGGRNMMLLRGLILYTVCRQACIYNPTTRRSLTLPAVKIQFFPEEGLQEFAFYFLGYDPVLDQYKVLYTSVLCSRDFETIDTQHWVYVLEAGGSWQIIKFEHVHLPKGLGLCINGVIYYMASVCMFPDTVISFDVRSEEFNMIQKPHEVPHFGKSVEFIEYRGKPALFYYTNLAQNGFVDLWVLEDDGVKWSKKSLVLKPCQMHLLDNNIDLVVVGATQNGEVILTPSPMSSPHYILYYDMQKNDLRKVEIRGAWEGAWESKTYMHIRLMDKRESIIHLEA